MRILLCILLMWLPTLAAEPFRFRAMDQLPPARAADSGVPFMQHMAVVRDLVVE